MPGGFLHELVSGEVATESVVQMLVFLSGELADEERRAQRDKRVVVRVDESVHEVVGDLEPHGLMVEATVGGHNAQKGHGAKRPCLRLRRERPSRPQIREPLAPLPPYAA